MAPFFAKIALPSALPDIVAGLRVSLASGAHSGRGDRNAIVIAGTWLGHLLRRSAFIGAPDLYAGLILLALLGFAANYLILLLEWRLLRWRNLSA